jgi:hypothetical protein
MKINRFLTEISIHVMCGLIDFSVSLVEPCEVDTGNGGGGDAPTLCSVVVMDLQLIPVPFHSQQAPRVAWYQNLAPRGLPH